MTVQFEIFTKTAPAQFLLRGQIRHGTWNGIRVVQTELQSVLSPLPLSAYLVFPSYFVVSFKWLIRVE